MGDHAIYSPSGASRWMNCHASMAFIRDLREQGKIKDRRRSTFYSAEGTAAHELREQCLNLGLSPFEFVGQTIEADGHEIPVDADMAAHLEPGINRIHEVANGARVHIERRVDLSRWLRDCWGTLDVGFVADGVIEINDLKYGAGIPVSPERNPQLMIYALGFYDNIARHDFPGVTRFRLVIDQPRHPEGGGEWECDLDTLLAFADELTEAQRLCESETPTFKPSPKACQFCDAKPLCRALSDEVAEIMKVEFDELEEDDFWYPHALTAEERSRVVAASSMIQAWVKAVGSYTLEQAMQGYPTPGFKAVRGRRGAGKWTDENAAREVLSKAGVPDEDMTKTALISPAQAKKLKQADTATKQALEAFVERAEGKPQLAPIDDKREAITLSADFDDLNEEDENDG